MKEQNQIYSKDIVGALCSGLCVLHCVLPAFAIGVSQAGLIGAMGESEWVHRVLVVVSVLIIAWVMPSALKIHRNPVPSILAGLGLCSLLSGLFIHELETPLTILGACMLMLAHGWNSWNLWQVKRVAVT